MTRKQARIFTGIVAVLAGMLVNYLGDRMLGVSVELWWGIYTFSAYWILDIFLVPFISGIVVAMIFGLGGKWLCYLPPILVRTISYFNFAGPEPIPDGAQLLNFYFWILIVILVVEASAFGGVAGELIVKRTYGRHPERIVKLDKEAAIAENQAAMAEKEANSDDKA